MNERLGIAHVQYDEWVDTSAADDHAGYEIPEFFGIDPHMYCVLRLRLSHFEGDQSLDAYAMHKDVASRYEELRGYAAAHDGTIPVRRFTPRTAPRSMGFFNER